MPPSFAPRKIPASPAQAALSGIILAINSGLLVSYAGLVALGVWPWLRGRLRPALAAAAPRLERCLPARVRRQRYTFDVDDEDEDEYEPQRPQQG